MMVVLVGLSGGLHVVWDVRVLAGVQAISTTETGGCEHTRRCLLAETPN
jgi:hypothetical protein